MTDILNRLRALRSTGMETATQAIADQPSHALDMLLQCLNEIEALQALFAKYEMCPVCGQHDNVGECTHEPGGVSIARIIWSDDIFANIDFGLVRELTNSTVKVLEDKGLM